MRHKLLLLVAINLMLVCANVWCGAVHIPAADVWTLLTGGTVADPSRQTAWHYIIVESRLPAALTALLTGAALGACGLVLQSFFRNPLAGPSVLGITSGANLAVAIVMLAGVTTPLGLTSAAMVGSLAILAMLVALSGAGSRLHAFGSPGVTLLIVGVLVGYVTSAVITLLNYYSTADGVQSYMVWGMGNFAGVGRRGMSAYATQIVVGLALCGSLVRPLNAWLLGPTYAQSLGISPRRTRILVLLATGTLAAVTTAWCGPIAFVGLASPHVARLAMRSDDHIALLPASALVGALTASLCLLLSTLPSSGRILPINALTPLFGVPVIVYILVRQGYRR